MINSQFINLRTNLNEIYLFKNFLATKMKADWLSSIKKQNYESRHTCKKVNFILFNYFIVILYGAKYYLINQNKNKYSSNINHSTYNGVIYI